MVHHRPGGSGSGDKIWPTPSVATMMARRRGAMKGLRGDPGGVAPFNHRLPVGMPPASFVTPDSRLTGRMALPMTGHWQGRQECLPHSACRRLAGSWLPRPAVISLARHWQSRQECLLHSACRHLTHQQPDS